MTFMLVYDKPGRGAYVYQYGARSLSDATEAGRDFAERDPEFWGTFRYARSSFRASIELDQYYTLKFGGEGLRYRKEWEEVSAPFDYISYSGPHKENLCFNLEWLEPISKGQVRLSAVFEAGRAFKFKDLCTENLAKFIIREGTPVMQFFDRFTYTFVAEIVLRTMH